MVKDLVCKMSIHKSDAAASHMYNGKRYYFCCKFCLVLFIDEPDKFIGKAKEYNQQSKNK